MRRRIVLVSVALSAGLVGVLGATLLSPPAGAAAAGHAVRAWGRGLSSAAASSAVTASAHRRGVRTLVFKATTLKLRSIDVDGDGKSDAGDYVIFTESLVGQHGTRAKGTDAVRCTLNSDGGGKLFSQCDGEFIFPGLGQITVYGLASPFVAVTGGTQAFAGARGQAKVVSINADSELITVTLLA